MEATNFEVIDTTRYPIEIRFDGSYVQVCDLMSDAIAVKHLYRTIIDGKPHKTTIPKPFADFVARGKDILQKEGCRSETRHADVNVSYAAGVGFVLWGVSPRIGAFPIMSQSILEAGGQPEPTWDDKTNRPVGSPTLDWERLWFTPIVEAPKYEEETPSLSDEGGGLGLRLIFVGKVSRVGVYFDTLTKRFVAIDGDLHDEAVPECSSKSYDGIEKKLRQSH
jgi:hypothetical protein